MKTSTVSKPRATGQVAPVEYTGSQPNLLGQPIQLYTLTRDISGYREGGTLSAQTLIAAGYTLPGKNPLLLSTIAESRLSPRELAVACAIGNGLTTREIALASSVSIKTVETQRTHIKVKTGVTNSAMLARICVAHVLSTTPAP